MKKNIYTLFVFAILLSVWGCNTPKNDNEKTLSVTIEPQKFFLEKIVGDRYVVNCIMSGNSNPESFDMSPMQVATISKSEAYFKTGLLAIENQWFDNILKNNSDIKLVDCSEEIIPLGDHACCDHDHSHDHHGHAGVDPHIWSSPGTAMKMADNMYKAMLQIDEDGKDYYTDNYNKLVTEINETDSIIRSYVEKAPSKSFIIYHPSLSYYAQQYGLNQYTIEKDGKQPSPTQLKELIDTSNEDGVKVVFMQMEYDQKNAETIVKSINGKSVSINLMAYNWSDEMIKIAKALAE